MQSSAWKQKFPTPMQVPAISPPAGMQGKQAEVVLPSRHVVHSYLARGDTGCHSCDSAVASRYQ